MASTKVQAEAEGSKVLVDALDKMAEGQKNFKSFMINKMMRNTGLLYADPDAEALYQEALQAIANIQAFVAPELAKIPNWFTLPPEEIASYTAQYQTGAMPIYGVKYFTFGTSSKNQQSYDEETSDFNTKIVGDCIRGVITAGRNEADVEEMIQRGQEALGALINSVKKDSSEKKSKWDSCIVVENKGNIGWQATYVSLTMTSTKEQIEVAKKCGHETHIQIKIDTTALSYNYIKGSAKKHIHPDLKNDSIMKSMNNFMTVVINNSKIL